MSENAQTLITDLAWGRIEVMVDGETRTFRDCKVWPGGAREWDWNDTGTQHDPGIQPADIEEILAHNVEVMILSRGQQERLKTRPETEAILRSRRITYHVEETNAAVARYNELARAGKRVGGIFHTTC